MLATASMSVMTPPGLAIDSMKIALVFGRDGALEGGDVVGVGPHHVPAEILERVVELVDRAAIELLRRHELVARLHQAVEHQHLRGMAGGDREAGGAAFERGDALLQHRIGRVADAGVDVAEGLQAEQGGGVIDVVEHEGRRLVDRGCARAGRRIGLGAGMDGERRKARECGRSYPVLAVTGPGVRSADRRPPSRMNAGQVSRPRAPHPPATSPRPWSAPGSTRRWSPPLSVERLSDMRWMPRPESCARFEERVRELTPIQPISEDSRPYSIFGQRFTRP